VRRSASTVVLCVLVMTGLATWASAASPPKSSSLPAAPLSINQTVTVTYCNHQQARITEPATLPGRAPAAIYVHGGSWVSGNYNTGGFLISEIGAQLAAKGFVVVGINYRLGPAARWPDQIEDAKCAVRYLRANARILNIDPSEIGVWGQSAGGHLAALLGTAGPSAGWDVGAYLNQSSKVQSVVDMAGPNDLMTLGDQGDSALVESSFVSLLGKTPPANLDAALKAASPVTYIAPGDPPFLIMHSDNDEIVYPQQSQELSWDLAANRDPHQLVMVQGAGHEFDQPGGSPTPAQITVIVVDYFIQTMVFHVNPPING
jgi:acetyl esterase/lipase